MATKEGVYQTENGLWAYRFSILIDGKRISRKKTTDELGNKLKTRAAALKARATAITAAHMDMEQAVITATDSYTDYKELIEDNHLGLWCESNDADTMLQNIKKLTEDKSFRENCAKNARKYLEKENTAEVAYSVIEKSYNEWKAKLS